MSERVKAHHLERGAYVYVRQSTPYQVRNNLESKQRQYALEGRAQQLGFSKVVVIDEDLGRSGSGIQERPGFGRLLASVCQGLAGAVFALEASRLARNNRDWHHLVDLCALTETLLIDSDGVYDPRQLNDRLVLGLKGTMSEFELGLLRQRAREAFEQKVRRGFALWEVPVGFIRTEDGTAPGEAQECQSEGTAIRRAKGISREPANAGAVAFRRAGDPNVGEFSDAVVLKKFGDVPEDLSEL